MTRDVDVGAYLSGATPLHGAPQLRVRSAAESMWIQYHSTLLLHARYSWFLFRWLQWSGAVLGVVVESSVVLSNAWQAKGGQRWAVLCSA